MLAFVLLFFLCSAQALIGFSRPTDVHLMSEMSFIQTSHKLVQSAVLALTVCSPINVKQIFIAGGFIVKRRLYARIFQLLKCTGS